MGQVIELEASDGHALSAYEAAPHTEPHRGGLVVIQEIFGVNEHVRKVADGYAAEGYYCIAPAIFDRAKRGVELDYGPESIACRPLDGRYDRHRQHAARHRGGAGGRGVGRQGRGGRLLPGRLARLARGDPAARHRRGILLLRRTHRRCRGRDAPLPRADALRRQRPVHSGHRCRKDPRSACRPASSRSSSTPPAMPSTATPARTTSRSRPTSPASAR